MELNYNVKSYFMMPHYQKLWAVLAFLTITAFLRAQVIAPFSVLYQTNQRGGIVFLSNSALGCSANPPVSSGTCQASAFENALGTLRNDDAISAFIDIDNDLSTFMSSSDSLDLSGCSQVTKAFLFWGASGSTTANRNVVKMKLNNGSYQTVVATASLSNSTGFDSYHCYADVTGLISGAGQKARITVADVNSSMIGTANTFGSWNLVVVYRNELMSLRQLTVYNGLAHLSSGTPSVAVPISGFLTPLLGSLTFEVGAYVHDGDRGAGADGLLFNGFPISDLTVNPLTDVMNSSVSNAGVANLFRRPLLLNTLGHDADIYTPLNTLNALLANSVTSSTIQLVTTMDAYLAQTLVTSLDTQEPDLRVQMRATDVNGGTLSPGDVIRYRMRAFNTGSDFSNNTVLTTTLDPGLQYVANSTSIVFGSNPGAKTDAGGDDQVTYNSGTRVLTVRIGAGANATSGGTVSPFVLLADSTVVTFSASVSQSCLRLSCNNTITASALISGSGVELAHAQSHASETETTVCRTESPVTSTVSTSGCTTPTASATPTTVCSGRSFTLTATSDPEATYSWTGPNSYTASGMTQVVNSASTALSGTYAVTLSIPSTTCQASDSRSVSVVNCAPSAVNDATTTSVNTTVSANASSNDINAVPNGTFSILVQPANGTVSIDAGTGVYTFTPATGFTGVTTATYQLCTSIPVVCVQASITFTVYPALVANPDLIVTQPSVTTTGSLLANDAGVVSGGTYTVSITQLPAGTGTLQINPANGQYTFIPNPAFTGSTQTTYTVCNLSLNPQLCSSATVTISVNPDPAPVNDQTTTIINVPVSANASANDGGTAGGTFIIIAQPVNGTVTMNPSTGQYTYTPPSNFTGVVTATYNLCNGAPVSCSAAVISITVYPLVTAVPDIINTQPLAVTSGTLLTNDLGITSGAAYSVSVTQPPLSVGAITLNPATGQYTFVPNALFTGTAQVTYTVCNMSVNPEQCSSTTITINVLSNPAPANDQATTIVNVPVSGNAAANDGGTAGGTFTIINQPVNGTVTMNPATGQYTYTPPANFTGVATATYNLCNGAPVSCSAAVISITVYPLVTAVPDNINTLPLANTSGTLVANDLGITPGASYSVSVTPPPLSVGSITLNPATGQYTFAPNATFTGTAQVTYTICNISVSPEQCSSTTITINVLPNPAPVNDQITTIINVPVSGNAAVNDGGASGGTFTIIAQPVNGTVTMNPATGQYTYTPPSGFTGVATATYNLCNGAPASCSAAVISITVYPLVTAVPDNIYTAPLASASGTLIANDLGITPGATYSVSVTQPPLSVGVIQLNPATGQYTFIPGLLFTGTAQVTYTVCNISVNPEQCSSTTITIIVSNLPLAVDDQESTLINTPVSGNAGTNDSGTLGGTFTFGNVLPGTGTLTGNPLTGQFLFTPATGFTGTTSATYTLCNLFSPPCSTATITFTVYPFLVANDDGILTTPSVSATGTLLANDSGVSSMAVYSVSITQLPPSTGTLIVDPTTGSYTFIPAPTFTGQTQTTYTVCNMSVNPQQCSSATIHIAVGNPPLAVNDFTMTLQDVPVSGNVSLNDVNTAGGTYTFSSSSSGTLSGNPNGQYTFTPAAGFTGTVSVSYTVCTPYSPPCASALLTLTVYPVLLANPDLVTTVMSTSVTGDLSTNDNGLVAGGSYSITVTPVAASIGTFQVASSGQYTFIPVPGYTGSTVTTYTLTQNVANIPFQSSVANVTIVVTNSGSPVGISKTISRVNYLANNTVELTYKIVVKNYGIQPLNTISVTDDLTATFPSPAAFTVVSSPGLSSLPASQLSVNPAYTGQGNFKDLLLSGTLAAGRTDTILFTVAVAPNGVQQAYANSAVASAVVAGSTITDTSVDMLDPDADQDGDPGNDAAPAIFNYHLARIGIAKHAGRSQNLGNGDHLITFRFTVENFGTGEIYNIGVWDDLVSTFGAASAYTITRPPASAKGLLLPDNAFNGASNTNLLLNTSHLASGAVDTIYLEVRYHSPNVKTYVNTALATGRGLMNDGFYAFDVSHSGFDPDPDGDNNPSGAGEDQPTTFQPSEEFQIPQGFSPNGDGVNDRFEIKGLDVYPNLELSILNRWGNIVFHKEHYDNSWDGKSSANVQFMGNELPEGTYFYIVDPGDGQKPLKGYVYINRSSR